MDFPLTQLNSSDQEYPDLLRQMKGHPGLLYVKGDPSILSLPCISIIGTRGMTAYGDRVTRLLIPQLVRRGVSIVSGLAYGVDAHAHRVALHYGGKCIVVLGSGLERIYPLAHSSLFQQVLEHGGCALSEYPPDTEPKPYHFPQRNRIVAGLSPVTLIIEAGESSGTMITARCALEAGREVAVVPGDITRRQSQGITELLKQGAAPVASVEDICALFPQSEYPRVTEELRPALTGSLATLYDLISRGTEETGELVVQSALTVTEVHNVLSVLELDGYITYKENRWQRI